MYLNSYFRTFSNYIYKIVLFINDNSFQIISSKQINSDNQQVIYCEDEEYRVYCDVCDNLCIERFYKNHLKSKTHNIRKREQLNKSFQVISQY